MKGNWKQWLKRESKRVRSRVENDNESNLKIGKMVMGKDVW
jgi:hypothetical protein